jgi:hypothetical protein
MKRMLVFIAAATLSVVAFAQTSHKPPARFPAWTGTGAK